MSNKEKEQKTEEQTADSDTSVEETEAAEPQQDIKVVEAPEKKATAEELDTESREDILEGELEALQDKMLRLHAEFDNFRKRNERERISLVRRANSDLLVAMLPVLDHFLLALGHDSDSGNFRDGVNMIYKQLDSTLTKFGLERIKALGKQFDPEFHEALISEASQDHDEGTVLEIMQEGYMLNGSVLRPVRVKVSSAAE